VDVSALSLKIDSADVVRATADLDKFSASSAKAAGAAGKLSNDGGRPAPALSRSGQAAAAAAASVDRYAAANTGAAATATQAAAAAQRAAQGATQAGAAARTSAAGWDMLTGRLNNNFVAINKNLQALNLVPASAARARAALNDNANAMQSTPGNIAAQFQDIGVTAAMGMSPLLIALQQGTQLSAAFAGGGLKSLGAALRSVISPVSLLTIAIVAGVAALIQWGIEAANSSGEADRLSKALDDVNFTTSALGDAQDALGLVMDLTTGKINSQSDALFGLAKAQLEVIRVTAIRDQTEANRVLGEEARAKFSPMKALTIDLAQGGLAGNLTTSSAAASIIMQFQRGTLGSSQAIDRLSELNQAGRITTETFLELIEAVSNYGMAAENLKIYEEARTAIEGGPVASRLLDPDKPRTRRGKTDAERLADLIRDAKEAITAEENRAKAVQMSALAAAELEQRTRLLNAAASAGLKITPALAAEIDKLAASYANAKVAADTAEAIKAATDAVEDQRQAVEDQIKLIGLYGDALARARRELEAQRQLRDSLPEGEIVVVPNLTGKLSDEIDAANRLQRLEDIRKAGRDAAYAMNLERGALFLTGKALIAYNYAAEQKLKYQREGIELSPEEVAAIDAAAAAYAQQRDEIDRTAKALADAREVSRGFFSDWFNGVREGESLFKSFADSVVNGLNRIIDRLMDRALDSFLDGLFSGGTGFLAELFGKSSGLMQDPQGRDLNKLGTIPEVKWPNALGGVYGTAQRFAKGGAFTNSIVNTPTLFRFANGARLGEMGEAGPEAIMPLKRGPNGALGVQVHGGGKPAIRMGDVHNNYSFAGAVGLDGILAMIRQGGEATYTQVKRDLQQLLDQLNRDGAFAS
jgi:hypothetical protein